jgi:hypothetical protein
MIHNINKKNKILDSLSSKKNKKEFKTWEMIHRHVHTSSYNQISNLLLNLWDIMWSHKFNCKFENEMCRRCIYIISLKI